MNENEFFETKDFYLTAYLKAKEIKFVKVRNGQNKNEFYFCFIQNPKLNIEVNSFYEGNSIIDTTKFINAIRDLKAMIYNLKN